MQRLVRMRNLKAKLANCFVGRRNKVFREQTNSQARMVHAHPLSTTVLAKLHAQFFLEVHQLVVLGTFVELLPACCPDSVGKQISSVWCQSVSQSDQV